LRGAEPGLTAGGEPIRSTLEEYFSVLAGFGRRRESSRSLWSHAASAVDACFCGVVQQCRCLLAQFGWFAVQVCLLPAMLRLGGFLPRVVR
jgi:hypothetical protein